MPRRQENDGARGAARTVREELGSEANRLLVRRVRVLLGILFVVQIAFALIDVVRHTGGLSRPLALKVVQIGLLLAVAPLIHTRRSRVANAATAAVAIALTNLTAGLAGGLRGTWEPGTLMLLVCSMATAAVLPWGARAQGVTALTAGLGIAVNVWLATGTFGPLESHMGFGVLVTLIGSVYVAWELEQQRREREGVAARLADQTHALEMIASGAPLAEVLHRMTRALERHIPGVRCSILLLEGDRLRTGSAPSLPLEYSAAIDGVVIGPEVGSCGRAAAIGAPVVTADIATDPHWEAYRALALGHGLRACWSVPILDSEQGCLGTFALYWGEPHAPRAGEQRLLARAAHLAGIAIERRRTEEALAASRRDLERESNVAGALARAGAEMMSALSTPLILERVCQLANTLLACDACDTVLRSADGTTWLPAAGHGYTADEWESLRVLRIPTAGCATLLESLHTRGVADLRTADVAEPLARKLLEQYGITASLYVPLRRGEDIVGFLSASYRGREACFGSVEHRVLRGIGQLASMALENARLVEELRSASQLKSEFVSTMSHELRTPLSVIIGYTDMLGDDPGADERQRILGRIRLASRELLELVESTLNLNRLEAGKDPVNPEAVPVDQLLEELAGEFAAMPRSADVALEWSTDPGLAAWADRRKLRIIVKNLVGNALKFTAAGSVRVTCRRAPGSCVFAVQDTGVGIAPEHLPVIFDMFRQADSSDARSYGGVGLGLYIVRRLLGVLGGTIDVASAPGRGTTFTFTVPSADADSPMAGTAP